MNRQNDRNIYYNIQQTNGNFGSAQAVFETNRVSPVLYNPSLYEMSVIRFSVPAYEIPILFFRREDLDPEFKGDDPEFYEVTLQYEDVIISKRLVHIENELPRTLYNKDAVWAYQELVDSINIGYKEAFDELKIAKPLAPQTEAPFITFDPVSNLFSLYAEQSYDVTSATTMGIFMNKVLFKLFPSFEIKFDASLGTSRNHQILVKNNKLNTTTYNGLPYFIMIQESSTLSQWSDFTSIQFQTNSIPVNKELLPTQEDETIAILTDFEITVSEPSRETIQYFPRGPLRFYDLKSEYPLSDIDLKITWKDKRNNTYPLYLSSGDSFTVKLLFRLKEYEYV